MGGNGCSLRARYGLGLGHHTMVGLARIVQVVWRSNCCSVSVFTDQKVANVQQCQIISYERIKLCSKSMSEHVMICLHWSGVHWTTDKGIWSGWRGLNILGLSQGTEPGCYLAACIVCIALNCIDHVWSCPVVVCSRWVEWTLFQQQKQRQLPSIWEPTV